MGLGRCDSVTQNIPSRGQEKGATVKKKTKRKILPSRGRPRYIRFMLLILTYNLLIILFLGVAIFLPDVIQMASQGADFMDRGAAASRMLAMHARVWPGIIVLLILIGIHSFRSFHRVLGPLQRFEEAFEQMAQGNFHLRVKLRKGDLLGTEQESFNTMMDALGEKLTASQGAVQEVFASLDSLEKAVTGQGKDPTIQKPLKDLRSKLQILSWDLKFFQTKKEDAPALAPEMEPRGLTLK